MRGLNNTHTISGAGKHFLIPTDVSLHLFRLASRPFLVDVQLNLLRLRLFSETYAFCPGSVCALPKKCMYVCGLWSRARGAVTDR